MTHHLVEDQAQNKGSVLQVADGPLSNFRSRLLKLQLRLITVLHWIFAHRWTENMWDI